jgi:uncharacterized cofD-like protein
MEKQQKNVVVIGGGTGTFTVLSGLKKYPHLSLTAIVTMADDGGSTGILRDEFGVLPPGDLRQCLVALAKDGSVLRKLFNHRYEKGSLAGHSFGNIFISTLEQVTGSLDKALDTIGNILKIKGSVVPVTLSKVRLHAKLKNGKMLTGEHEITSYQLLSRFGIESLALSPKARVNPKALQAIAEADLIIVGPGNLYASLIPNFLVPGVGKALARAKAQKVYVANLMNKHGHTDDFAVADYVQTLERYSTPCVFDTVIYNTKKPARALLARYSDEGEPLGDTHGLPAKYRALGKDLLSRTIHTQKKKDPLRRTLIRHDQDKLARAIVELL